MLRAIAFVVLAMLPAGVGAQTVTRQNEVTSTATITAIDQASRSVTLRAPDGAEESFTVGPAVKRFNELKVGDTIRATYYESMVLQLRKPGAAAAPTGSASVMERLKDQPGGVIGTLETMTVTVKAVDMKTPALTVVTPLGLMLTRKVAEPKNLEGVTPGDRIEISYSKGVIVAADPSRK